MSDPIFVINGFYMSMREKFTLDSVRLAWFLYEWDEEKLSWADFRAKTLGATDPTTAEPGSLRREILEKWKDLGLQSEPNVGDNGMHASASPFEAMAERLNWCGAKVESDPFAQALIAAGVNADTLNAWTKDPQVEFEGNKGSLFDNLEDLNCSDCLKKAQAIAGGSGAITLKTNQAFVFIKPHAYTEKTVELAKSTLAAAGLTLVNEGLLDGPTIEKNLLIDNHYYAIACKASLTKPKDLNPPAAKREEFEKLFGLSWEKALETGVVYNAVDGCTKLGVTGSEMDTLWAKTKKAGQLVKFGGGFYCGKVSKE
eukprot:NODE_3941_length_1138_cov_206.214778_g3750_i0.p1 GENE.NODE_3941_length_1138_cov_206.214778_g3750_i0~~NODE_3941_length_1138_cov_206.214778_g3750_i0.p1  ORF type:complete len:313 (-),score=124.06 NODE_3941_length_1138_cov_206.214778_g3750_i0:140-1078(-)